MKFVSLVILVVYYCFVLVLTTALFAFVIRNTYRDFQLGSHPLPNLSKRSSHTVTDTPNSSAKDSHPSQSPSQHQNSSRASRSSINEDIFCFGLTRTDFYLRLTDTAISLCCFLTMYATLMLLLMLLSWVTCGAGGRSVAVVYQWCKCTMYLIFLKMMTWLLSITMGNTLMKELSLMEQYANH